MKDDKDTLNGPLVNVDRDSNGEIIGWGITVKTTDAIKMLKKALREATEQGDQQQIRGTKKLLQGMPDPRKTDEITLYCTQKSLHNMSELQYRIKQKQDSKRN